VSLSQVDVVLFDEFCADQPNHVSLRSGFVNLSRQGSNRGFAKYIDETCIVGTYSSRFKFLLHILTLDNGLARLKKDEMRLQLQCEAVFLFRHSVVGVQNGRHGSKTAFHF